MPEYASILFSEVLKILMLLVPVLVSVAMIVWLDRRVWAFVQKRRSGQCNDKLFKNKPF